MSTASPRTLTEKDAAANFAEIMGRLTTALKRIREIAEESGSDTATT